MKRNRLFAAALAGAMMLSLAACGGNSGDGETKTLSIGYTTASNNDDPYHITALRFKEIVEEKSNGRITVNEYPSNQLGSEPEMWEGMQIGTCDMAVMTNAYENRF